MHDSWSTDPTGMAMFGCHKEIRNCRASAESCRTWQGDSKALQTTYGDGKWMVGFLAIHDMQPGTELMWDYGCPPKGQQRLMRRASKVCYIKSLHCAFHSLTEVADWEAGCISSSQKLPQLKVQWVCKRMLTFITFRVTEQQFLAVRGGRRSACCTTTL